MAKAAAEVEELPRAIVRRVVKEKLSESSSDGEIYVHKEALLAFSESARIFIHYLSATANDICKESKRQTLNAGDIFKALEEIEFPEFIGPLKASLDDFKRKNAGKKAGAAKAKEADKKRKMEEEPSEQNEDQEDGREDEGEEADEDENDNADSGVLRDCNPPVLPSNARLACTIEMILTRKEISHANIFDIQLVHGHPLFFRKN
ncbi:Transcription factor CBF/NF-Y/archaeal histone [Macleaya cordata]|uniref:Transcription factor CBF/NF-Y/archaeal histone n=1 Tax=Macleaya cordata TaxID=56857 RepID=A0A200Q6B8_MACCD|nr:Transcription factor CBF/NF-Y/archaeal histone [Macleaya cordata]